MGVPFTIFADVVAQPSHSFLGLGDITMQLRLKGFGWGGLYKDVFCYAGCESGSKLAGPLGESVYGVLAFRLAVDLVFVRCGYQEVVYVGEDACFGVSVRPWWCRG